jgi:hypothetical protein
MQTKDIVFACLMVFGTFVVVAMLIMWWIKQQASRASEITPDHIISGLKTNWAPVSHTPAHEHFPQFPDGGIECFDEARKHIWDYFRFHADQRIKLFQFYLALSTFVFGGAAFLFDHHHILASFMATLQAFLSIVFYKLDRRHRTFVDIAECAHRRLESFFPEPAFCPFTVERRMTEGILGKNTDERRGFFGRYMTSSPCFIIVFQASGGAAALLAMAAGFRPICETLFQ